MPFQNRLQYNRQWDIIIPATICALLGLIGQIDLLIRVTMFWNLPNRNFNTFIAQFTLTSRNENWEALFIDIHIDRERSNRVNPTPGRSPMSDTLQHVRNQWLHPPAPREPHEETSDEEGNATKEMNPAVPYNLVDIGVPIPGPPNYWTSETFHHEWNLRVPPLPEMMIRAKLPATRREVVEGPVQIVPPRAPAYSSWSEYFHHHPEMWTNWQSPRPLPSTRPLQVRPRPRPFTPHPEPKVVDVSSGDSTSGDREMEEMPCSDEPGILVWLDTLPFSHFSISTPTLTYHDAWNRHDASRKRAQCLISIKSLLLATPLFGNIQKMDK